MNETVNFIYIDSESSQLKHDYQQFEGYQADKIKFMTKVEVNQNRCEGSRSRIKIAKEPIYAQEDVIIFLLILEWFPNSVQTMPKVRKGSFATEKQLKVRFQQTKIQHEDLLSIIYLLSEKIYIEERHIDSFTKVVEGKSEIFHKQQNCLTVIVGGLNQKGKLANVASTMDETRCQYYWYDSTSYANTQDEKNEKSLSVATKNENFLNKIPLTNRNSSRIYQVSPRSPRVSLGSRDMISEDTQRRVPMQFNIEKGKKLFSSVEYILAESQVCTEMIVYHLSDSQNITNSGLRLHTLKEVIDQWPRFSSFKMIYKLNRDSTMKDLISQAKNNYNLMISMEFKEINQKNIDNIYQIINQFNHKIMQEFTEAAKQYRNDDDYNEYLTKLQHEISVLETELLNNYGITKKEYGSRILKNIQKKNYKNSLQNYTLMKILGKQQINQLEIGFRRYKDLIVENYLEQGFEEFKHKKNRLKNRYFSRQSENYEEEELNYVENRIQICEGKKTMLDKAIELELRENQSLKLMLKLFEKDQVKESFGSQNLNF